jgi:DNA repair photolyase
MSMQGEPRFKRVNVCGECPAKCNTRTRCSSAKLTPRSYGGIRFTSDGFDCALPVSMDSFSHCSYGCVYCFSDNTIQHREASAAHIGETSLKTIERLFAGEPSAYGDQIRTALKYHDRNKNGYPCPVQLGTLNDPCDHIERHRGWLLEYIDIAIKYRQPTRISTKGTVFQLKEYLDRIAKAPELFWVAFSIITPDDSLIEKIDLLAPNATQRIKTMKALSDVGVKTSLRFRPMLPGASDKTKRYPRAYKTLIEMAAEAGASAVSYEVAFVPGRIPAKLKSRWQYLQNVLNFDLAAEYRKFGAAHACMRPPYTWTENIQPIR